MDNLLKIGIEQETIDKMIEVNDIFLVEELDEKHLNTLKIINTLRELKIDKENIDLMLINYIDIFLMDYDSFVNKLKDVDLNDFSNMINNDLEAAYDIFF